jgi:CheY-like chemotaxis protein/two-component sensor histidine kinase
MGSLDLLRRRGLGEREQRMIDGALQAADRAKVLVQRLLAFARRQPLQPVTVDVAALVAGMADLIDSTSGPRVRVELDLAPDLPPARADTNQLELAILNLAVNARDAMPDGGTLSIAARPETASPGQMPGLVPGDYLRLTVADTGSGMDEATLARAIEPFFSTKGVGKGTGLGLSMVHGLAAQLGGALAISSKPGLGTAVDLWLPVSSEAVQAFGREAERQAPLPVGTALVVDDEELVRLSTADMLADLGYAVVEAGSGEQALQLVERGLTFDLLVTDHLMSGMTGTELAREVRARRADVMVLVVSGYADVEGIAPDLARLTKPYQRDDLAASLAALASAERGPESR